MSGESRLARGALVTQQGLFVQAGLALSGAIDWVGPYRREDLAHRQGQPAPHRGGQAILTLCGVKTMYWASAAGHAGAERNARGVKDATGPWPFGNRVANSGEDRAPLGHGVLILTEGRRPHACQRVQKLVSQSGRHGCVDAVNRRPLLCG